MQGMVGHGLSAPATLGRYRVVRQLGEGGMAQAWLATAPDGSPVVLKIPLEPTPQMTVKLRDEAQAGMRVQHAHVVSTLDFFVEAGRPVLVIEYVDGCALRDLRTREGARNPLPAPAVAWLGKVIAEALVAIHEAKDDAGAPLGMLHRDVTASNILIARDGAPKIIDLGIARSAENQGEQTQVGMLKGTLRYLAPELLLGESYSASTDLWSLGVSLFEAALGRQMVSGEAVDIFRALTSGQYRNLRPGEHLEPALKDALFMLLADKEQRLRNARAAARMFAGVEARLGPGGQHVLATMVPFAQDNTDDDAPEPAPKKKAPTSPSRQAQPVPTRTIDDEFADAVGTVSSLARGPRSATQETPPQSTTVSNKIVIGGTAFGTAATLQMAAVDVKPATSQPSAPPSRPVADVGPTMILPKVDVPAAAPPARAAASSSSPSASSSPSSSSPPPSSSSPSSPLGQGSIGPTMVLPRVDVSPPGAPAARPAPSAAPSSLGQGSIGPTLVLPKVDVSPAVSSSSSSSSSSPSSSSSASSSAPASAPLLGSIGPTLVMARAEVALPRPTPPIGDGIERVDVRLDRAPPPLQGAPTIAMAAVDVAPAAGDVLPAGMPTVQMAAWSPDQVLRDDPSSDWGDDTDKAMTRPASSPSATNRPSSLPPRPQAPSSHEARPTLQMPVAALPGTRNDE